MGERVLTSTLMIDTGDPVTAENLYKILLPEVRTTKTKHSKISIGKKNGILYLDIEAKTIAGLRALLNSYLRWIATSIDLFYLKKDK
ncbi:MAG: KEOPS complex subunit Pcc1 [Candidatus Methanomethylicaceae archaeon]|nr:KEOPS complex subunit Pcc1 [Candidatus Verstraetearchaeota archaeon]